MVTWWFNPIDNVTLGRITPGVFDERGIVAIGYAGFAFALGLTAHESPTPRDLCYLLW